MSAELSKSGGALAVRLDQTTWTEQQAAVLRQSGIGESVTRAELDGFLHLCQRTGLDPFSRQIYLIGRWDRRAQREVYTPQTGIDGYRVVARRATAMSGGTYGYEDTLWCDESGRWRDVWLVDGPPAAAKVTVVRDKQRFSAVARYSEYVQTNKDGKPIGMWAKMPAGQLAKCTEALALRKAFPHDLAGVYTAEEMAQADNPASGRHLRRVQPGEGDPWANAQQGEEFAPHAEAQALAVQASEATARSEVTEIVDKAKDSVPSDARIKAPDTGETDALREYLTRRWKALPKEPEANGTVGADVIDGEVVDGPAEDKAASAAESELRAFAAEHGIDDIARDAEEALGMPLELAPADAIRGLLNQLRGSAA
ncbi:phage recombination protein Bet [Streptomyces cinnamoneus]|uniref:phage recombination protein Bet n=1 Tax=Streptomyces cinnamoneus TaxID=53446 RepID=UPI0033FB08B0